MSLKITRVIRVHGKKVTLNARVVGARDGSTGGAAITYGDDQVIKAIIGKAMTTSVGTELGDVTSTTRSIKTITSFGKGDKITLTDGKVIEDIETTPQTG